jgi:PAS domain S-box-containing protein
MQHQKVIEQLGYSPKEAKVYMTSLRLGESHVSDIAQKVGMARNTVQAIVEKLQTDGLMSFYVLRRYKYWSVESPERLLTNLHKREEAVRTALPALIEMRKLARKKVSKKNQKLSMTIIRAWADSSEQPMLVTDTDAMILYVNTLWEQQFGYLLEEVLGKSTKMLASGKTPKDVHLAMWQSLDTGKLFQTYKIIDKRKDGTCFSMQTTVFTVSHGDEDYFVQLLQPT